MENTSTPGIELLDIMRYYVVFKDIEEPILNAIHGTDEEQRMVAYRYYVHNHMKIGRNFKAGTDKRVLEETQAYFRSGKKEIGELSNIYQDKDLLSGNIQNATVAASKLLWLFDKETIIIDNLNKNYLKSDDYNSYVDKFKNKFYDNINQINMKISKFKLNETNTILDKIWFKMRVFDQYLLSINPDNIKVKLNVQKE